MDISLIATLAKRVGAVCLAMVIFWHVVRHAGPRQGTAIVHVPQSNVVVAVDDQSYHVESIAQSPLVCDLEPGSHVVKLRHGGLLLGEEDFTVEAGKEVVVCPFHRLEAAAAAASGGSESRPEAIGPPGLMVRAAARARTPLRDE